MVTLNCTIHPKKLVGIDIKNNQLKSSISMINIYTQDMHLKEKEVELTK